VGAATPGRLHRALIARRRDQRTLYQNLSFNCPSATRAGREARQAFRRSWGCNPSVPPRGVFSSGYAKAIPASQQIVAGQLQYSPSCGERFR